MSDIGERVACVARGWIGTPYRHQASSKAAGADCLGLLRGVWREIYGDEPEAVPAYTPDWSEPQGNNVCGGRHCGICWCSRARRWATFCCFACGPEGSPNI